MVELARAQGLLRMTKDQFKSSAKVLRLWVHECERVFRDRLVNEHDLGKYDDMLAATLKNWFKEENLAEVQAAPNLFTAFMTTGADEQPIYSQVRASLCVLCILHLGWRGRANYSGRQHLFAR